MVAHSEALFKVVVFTFLGVLSPHNVRSFVRSKLSRVLKVSWVRFRVSSCCRVSDCTDRWSRRRGRCGKQGMMRTLSFGFVCSRLTFTSSLLWSLLLCFCLSAIIFVELLNLVAFCYHSAKRRMKESYFDRRYLRAF